MASSGSISTSEMEGRSISLQWSSTPNNAGNYSTVTWKVVSTGSYASGVAVREITAKINGTQVYHTDNYNSVYGGNVPVGVTIATGTVKINHNTNGEGSFTAYIGAGIYYQWAINTENSKTFTLDPIPRASSISCPTFTLGTSGNITITKASSGFTHTITYSWGNDIYKESGTICEKSSNTTIAWTPSLDLAKAIPNAVSGRGTMVCDTYNGSTKVGSKSILFTCNVPTNIVPTINSLSYTLDNSANSIINAWNIAVVGYTKIKFSATASSLYNATISEYEVNGGCNSILTAESDGSLNAKTDAITKSGDVVFNVVAVDSRGRKSTAQSVTISNCYDYAKPTISSFFVNRGTEIKTVDGVTTSDVKVKAVWKDSSIGGKNSSNAILKYKLKTSESWVTSSDVITNDTEVLLSTGFDITESYDFQLIITDTVGNSISQLNETGVQECLLHFGIGGKTLGIGTIVEKNLFTNGGVKVNPDWEFNIYGKNLKTLILDMTYPVGSIYMSVNSTDPSISLGGTWESWGSGRVPLGMGSNGTTNYTTVEKTGGSETATLDNLYISGQGYGALHNDGTQYKGRVAVSKPTVINEGNSATAIASVTTHNNMPPYITCYMWKRTA